MLFPVSKDLIVYRSHTTFPLFFPTFIHKKILYFFRPPTFSIMKSPVFQVLKTILKGCHHYLYMPLQTYQNQMWPPLSFPKVSHRSAYLETVCLWLAFCHSDGLLRLILVPTAVSGYVSILVCSFFRWIYIGSNGCFANLAVYSLSCK